MLIEKAGFIKQWETRRTGYALQGNGILQFICFVVSIGVDGGVQFAGWFVNYGASNELQGETWRRT